MIEQYKKEMNNEIGKTMAKNIFGEDIGSVNKNYLNQIKIEATFKNAI